MKTSTMILSIVLSGCGVGQLSDEDGERAASSSVQELMLDQGCLACHSETKKLAGPSFRQIADMYRGQDVEAQLVAKVRDGGAGRFGQIPMPANPELAETQSRSMVGYILATRSAEVAPPPAEPAPTSSSTDPLRFYGCQTCHSAAKKLVGPSFREIAERYQGMNVLEKLAATVRAGSSNAYGSLYNFGYVPMPPNSQVPEETALTVVANILATPLVDE